MTKSGSYRVRTALIAVSFFCVAVPVAAQLGGPPSGIAAVELNRSRACVGVFERVDRVNEQLDPLAQRTRRVAAIAEAVTLEDRGIVPTLDEGDALETSVRDWFEADGALAERYVAQQDPTILDARRAGRIVIQATVTEAMDDLQAQADAIVTANQDLMAASGPCDGAIFVRAAVLEGCQTASAVICDQAALPASEVSGFRFVDTPESVWDIQEFRAWTSPGPLRAGPTGQLEGARTVGYARAGNVVVSVAFTPMLRDREDATPLELQSWQATNDSLGLSFTHPSIAFAPALGVRAALPEALGGEVRYVLHFGAPTDPRVVWRGEAGTGQALEGTVPIGAEDVMRLQAGEPIALTAIRPTATGEEEASWTLALSPVNQGPATQALLGYMVSQLSVDLNALVRPRG